MDQPWIILELRYGEAIDDPSAADLARAIRELYVEDLPGMTEGDYEEHGMASMRYGFDAGPMYTLNVTRGGIATFEEWADQDDEMPLAPPRVLDSVSPGLALELWGQLASGNLELLRRQPWDDPA